MNTKLILDGLIKLIDYGNAHMSIELNNPPVNALSINLVDELNNALSIVAKMEKIKLLTISSADVHFSAGADLKERSMMSEEETIQFLENLNNCFDLIEDLEVPTIAYIKGATLGGGAELALCCDIVVARQTRGFGIPNAKHKIGFPETKLGIIPGAGGTYRLHKKMSQGAAKYWILSAKQFSLEEAFEYSFVDLIIKQSNDYFKLISSILENSKTSLISAKKSINKCYLELDRKKQRLIELGEYKKTLNSQERKEALKKYKKK